MASLIRRTNGIYYAVYGDGTRRRWLSLHTDSFDKAKESYNSLIPSLEKPRGMRLSLFREQLHQYCTTNLAEGTVQIYNRTFKALQNTIGNLPLKNIRLFHIEEFKQARLKTVSRITVNISLRTLRAGFQLAADWGLVAENPARKCKLLRVPMKESAFLNEDAFLNVCSQTKDIRFRRFLWLAGLTGMRRGELLNLHWEDLDFQEQLIRIRNRSNFVVKGLRPRTIPMPGSIRSLFEPDMKARGYVFSNDDGVTHWNPHTVSRRFKQLARRAALPEGVHLHSLRHSYASWMIQAHVPLFQVQALLGHRSGSTSEIYTHLTNDSLRETLNLVHLPAIQQLNG
jgi:integrase